MRRSLFDTALLQHDAVQAHTLVRESLRRRGVDVRLLDDARAAWTRWRSVRQQLDQANKAANDAVASVTALYKTKCESDVDAAGVAAWEAERTRLLAIKKKAGALQDVAVCSEATAGAKVDALVRCLPNIAHPSCPSEDMAGLAMLPSPNQPKDKLALETSLRTVFAPDVDDVAVPASSRRRGKPLKQQEVVPEALRNIPGINLIPKTTQEPIRCTQSYSSVDSNGVGNRIKCSRVCTGEEALKVFDQAVSTIQKACAQHGWEVRVVTLAAKNMAFTSAKEALVEIRKEQSDGRGGEWCGHGRVMLVGTLVTRHLRLYEDEKPISTHIRRRAAHSVHIDVSLEPGAAPLSGPSSQTM